MNNTISSAYNKILWGLIFVGINLRIQRFDVVPNFIGFFLIASGFYILSSYNKNFLHESQLSILLVFLSFNSIITTRIAKIGGLYLAGGFYPMLSLMETILELLLSYRIIKSIIYFSKKWKQPSLEKKCYTFLQVWAILIIIMLMLSFLIYYGARNKALLYLLSFMAIVIYIYLYTFVTKAKNQLRTISPDYNPIVIDDDKEL